MSVCVIMCVCVCERGRVSLQYVFITFINYRQNVRTVVKITGTIL